MLPNVEPLALHEWHLRLGARLGEVEGCESVQSYGDARAEYKALRNICGVLDLGFRGRLCLTGKDRVRFLNGQVTNDVKALVPGQGCYAALITTRGKMESDLHIHCLKGELLLDFEPGLSSKVITRLNQYIVADDVEVVDLRSHYGLLSVQGPKAVECVKGLGLGAELPPMEYRSITHGDGNHGEWVLANLPRFATCGVDLFVPQVVLATVADRLTQAAKALGGRPCGWESMEMVRIEAGIPRYGQDMDASNIPLEAGLEERAVRYNKGCYIGQEVINRIHSIGQVTRSLRGLKLSDGLPQLPQHGDQLLHQGKPVGFITSAIRSAAFGRNLALGYVRKEVNQPGTLLSLTTVDGEVDVTVLALPFEKHSL